MLDLLTKSLEATASLEETCTEAFEPYTDMELHKLTLVQNLIDSTAQS